ncbi:phosphate transporter [Calycina marina]|uniref:Phosphate transporter n=1 Tax=Calycina marina TaxID=1763456 RepID=A0A9P7YTV6_9HELO|nr:phosphate transporter [Calycina marina]
MAVLGQYNWLIAIISIAFCFSAFGNGANDVANSYATSVAARTLTMVQVGFLSIVTEFVGAVALGARVTSTVKNSIIGIDRFRERPGVLILAMTCAEVGSATWLMVATRLGLPVSTTQTIVGALIGVGFASEAPIKWAWTSGSVSQVVASWAIAPLIAGAMAALIFGTVKYLVLERENPMKQALRFIPFYLAFTAAMLALFIVVEAPTAPSLEEFGAGKACGIILGVFFGMLAIAYIFFMPYFTRRLIKGDARLRWYHVPMGPLLRKENVKLYFPGDPNGDVVTDHYKSAHKRTVTHSTDSPILKPSEEKKNHMNGGGLDDGIRGSDHVPSDVEQNNYHVTEPLIDKEFLGPHKRFLDPVANLSLFNPKRLWGITKFVVLQGVTRDCVSHDSERLADVHDLAKRYDNKVEHLWTYPQVASAMLMSIAHGSNDVANAVGPWSAALATYETGSVNTRSPTPVWMLVVAGFLLGLGFWVFGYHIIRSLGNKITQLSPTRGFSMELGAAITVLLASRLGLPVSTTQCLTGATVGVALMNYNVRAVNWRQVLFIFSGWVFTLPIAGLISGLLMVMSLNAPHF